MKTSSLDRGLLLLTCLLAAWQVAVGINGADTLPLAAYTIGFGVLLVAALMGVILGFDGLESPSLVVVSTIIPLGLSLGLVWEYADRFRIPYLVFATAGLLIIVITRIFPSGNKIKDLLLPCVHGLAGVMIFILPILMVVSRLAPPSFLLISLGGTFIGVGGVLLSLDKTNNQILPHRTIRKALPVLLLLMTMCFVAGFNMN
jgi:hypothetical protein